MSYKYIYYYRISGFFFRLSPNVRKCVAFLFCASLFLRLKKFLIEKNTEYNFYVLKKLRFKRHRENYLIFVILQLLMY